MNILAVRYGHSASAALIKDGNIVADIMEERFSRIKNDSSFPIKSIEYCLRESNLKSDEIDCLAIPTTNFQHDFRSFFKLNKETTDKLDKSLKYRLKKRLGMIPARTKLPLYQEKFNLNPNCKVKFYDHHLCHIASAAYTSGLNIKEKVLGFTMDGIGDKTSVAVWEIHNNKIKNLMRINGNGSLGWFYGICNGRMY